MPYFPHLVGLVDTRTGPRAKIYQISGATILVSYGVVVPMSAINVFIWLLFVSAGKSGS